MSTRPARNPLRLFSRRDSQRPNTSSGAHAAPTPSVTRQRSSSLTAALVVDTDDDAMIPFSLTLGPYSHTFAAASVTSVEQPPPPKAEPSSFFRRHTTAHRDRGRQQQQQPPPAILSQRERSTTPELPIQSPPPPDQDRLDPLFTTADSKRWRNKSRGRSGSESTGHAHAQNASKSDVDLRRQSTPLPLHLLPTPYSSHALNTPHQPSSRMRTPPPPSSDLRALRRPSAATTAPPPPPPPPPPLPPAAAASTIAPTLAPTPGASPGRPGKPNFNTTDRTILEELQRTIRARENQFVPRGPYAPRSTSLVGQCSDSGTGMRMGHMWERSRGGGRHHPFPKEDVPYPRNYEREIIDL
jgi:hypothetical protein